MPTKTISIELDAYEKLKAAKTGPGDSFTKVIRREEFSPPYLTGQALLNRLGAVLSKYPDDGRTLEEALGELPQDPPVIKSPWDEVEEELAQPRA